MLLHMFHKLLDAPVNQIFGFTGILNHRKCITIKASPVFQVKPFDDQFQVALHT